MDGMRTPIQRLTSRGDRAGARNKYRGLAPTCADPEAAAEAALNDAQGLAGLVRDEDPCVVAGALAATEPHHLQRIAIALAALVPIDQAPSELLEWLPAEQEYRRLRAAGVNAFTASSLARAGAERPHRGDVA